MAAGDIYPTNAPDVPGTPSTIPGEPSSVPAVGNLVAPAGTRMRDVQGRFVTNGFGWEWVNLNAFFNLPQDFENELFTALEEHMRELASEIEEYAKENAPWTDQTGDARKGLKAIYIRRNDNFEIDLGGSVNYQVFLEQYNGGEYAIIQPTLRQYAPQILQLQNATNVSIDNAPFEGDL